jgi:hypothetical protein
MRIVGVAIAVLFSWSAGKDSAFGLWTLLRDQTYEVRALLTTITDGYDRVSMSGVREDLLDRQADVLGLPLLKVKIPPVCPNEVYEERMASALASEALAGIDHVAFSDLFLEDVRTYREERLGRAGKHGVFPLWGRDTMELAREIVGSGFRAVVVCVDPRANGSLFRRTGLRPDVPRGPSWGSGPVPRERRVPYLRLGRPRIPRAHPVPDWRSCHAGRVRLLRRPSGLNRP